MRKRFTDFFVSFQGAHYRDKLGRMAKLDALKEKIATLRAGLLAKLDKIAFIKKLREKQAQAAQSSSVAPSSSSLGTIYRDGGVATRLQVILVYMLAIAAIGFTVHAGRKVLKRVSSSKAHEELKKDYSTGLSEMNAKVVENANLISLGKFTSNVNSADGKVRLIAVDVWVRVSDPHTADFAQKNETILHDKIVEALELVAQENVDPLTVEGKNILKSRMMESLNHAFPKGKAEDILFQNLVVE